MFQRNEEHGGWKQPAVYEKLLFQALSSSYQIEQKTFIEACCNNNIHTGEKIFCGCDIFESFWSVLSRQSKNTCSILGLYGSSLDFHR